MTDNGRGIAAEERGRVLQRFYRSASAVRLDTVPDAGARGHNFSSSLGSGLGLSIAKRIVELHGGTLDIATPAAGSGVSLIASLPLASQTRAE